MRRVKGSNNEYVINVDYFRFRIAMAIEGFDIGALGFVYDGNEPCGRVRANSVVVVGEKNSRLEKFCLSH